MSYPNQNFNTPSGRKGSVKEKDSINDSKIITPAREDGNIVRHRYTDSDVERDGQQTPSEHNSKKSENFKYSPQGSVRDKDDVMSNGTDKVDFDNLLERRRRGEEAEEKRRIEIEKKRQEEEQNKRNQQLAEMKIKQNELDQLNVIEDNRANFEIQSSQSESNIEIQQTSSSSYQQSSIANEKRNENQQQTVSFNYQQTIEILLKPIVGSDEQKKELLKKQEYICNEIVFNIKDKDNDEQNQQAINAGVSQQLSYIFETCDISSITFPFIDAFYQIAYSFPKTKILLYEKKNPYPGLLRLIELHQNQDIVLRSMKAFNSILLGGIETTQDYSEHPHFEVICACQGVQKIFSVYQRSTVIKDIKDAASISLGRIFKSKEMPNLMRSEIISHLKSNIYDLDQLKSSQSTAAIIFLAMNQVNYNEIMKNEYLRTIAAFLRLNIHKNEKSKQQIIQIQQHYCEFLTSILINKFGKFRNVSLLQLESIDMQLSVEIVKAGIYDALLEIFETREVDTITSHYIKAFGDTIIYTNEDFKLLLVKRKNPYPGLIHLLEIKNNSIVFNVLCNIHVFISAGSKNFGNIQHHPHFEQILERDGLNKLLTLYKRTDSIKRNKDQIAIIIGHMFCRREIPNSELRTDIISHLKSNMYGNDFTNSCSSTTSLSLLSLNQVNFKETLKNDFLYSIQANLRKTLQGTKQQQEKLKSHQQNDCQFLSFFLYENQDEKVQKLILDCGIYDSLILFLENQDLSIIGQMHISPIYCLSQSNNLQFLIKLQTNRSPYPALIRLLQIHGIITSNIAVNSLYNFLKSSQSIYPNSSHIYFNLIQQFDGVNKLYSFFTRCLDQITKDVASMCYGVLFSAKTIPDPKIRSEIISYLKSNLNNPIENIREGSMNCIKVLAIDEANRSVIAKDGFKIPK